MPHVSFSLGMAVSDVAGLVRLLPARDMYLIIQEEEEMGGRETGGQDTEAPVEWPPRRPERPRPRIFGAVLGALVVWTIILMMLAFVVIALMTPGTPAGF